MDGEVAFVGEFAVTAIVRARDVFRGAVTDGNVSLECTPTAQFLVTSIDDTYMYLWGIGAIMLLTMHRSPLATLKRLSTYLTHGVLLFRINVVTMAVIFETVACQHPTAFLTWKQLLGLMTHDVTLEHHGAEENVRAVITGVGRDAIGDRTVYDM